MSDIAKKLRDMHALAGSGCDPEFNTMKKIKHDKDNPDWCFCARCIAHLQRMHRAYIKAWERQMFRKIARDITSTSKEPGDA